VNDRKRNASHETAPLRARCARVADVTRTPARLAAAALLLVMAGCLQRTEDTAAYKAACHGPPLHGVEEYEQAQVAGYTINRVYDCIDKASFEAVAAQKAQWEAANTPAAIAQREAEWAQKKAEGDAQRERDEWQRQRDAEREARELDEAAKQPVAAVDVNRAWKSDLAAVASIGADTAQEIVAERRNRRFDNWIDLIRRVRGLGTAQTAVYASVCGLTVDGNSLAGAPPNARMAAMLKKKYAAYR